MTARSRSAGMTIMEVLIATMLLGVLSVVVFSAFGIGLRSAALASGMNTATGLAEETLTRLVASPCGSSFTLPVPPEPEDERYARYRREAAVSQIPGTHLWEFRVTVSWTQERQARSVTLATLRYVSEACRFVAP